MSMGVNTRDNNLLRAQTGRPARSAGRRRVLMLTHRAPFPPDRGDRIRAWHLLKTLSEHFDVALAATTHEPLTAEQYDALMDRVKTLAVEPLAVWGSRIRALGGLCLGRAATPEYFFRPTLARQVLRWHADRPFDAVLTFCTGMVAYSRPLMRLPDRPRHVLDLVDVDSDKWAQWSNATRPPQRWFYNLEARRLRAIEACRHDLVDSITVVSQTEAALYRDTHGPDDRLHVVGNGVDLDYFHPQPLDLIDPTVPRLLFTGVLDYRPNVDALVWFTQHVLPLLHRQGTQVRLTIVGRDPSPKVWALGRLSNVDVIGPVPDVRPYLAQAALVIAPLRLARGVQNKALEAMSSQRAVIGSPAVAQGLDATPGRDFLLADAPQQWADAVTELVRYPTRRDDLAAAGRRRVEQTYRWPDQLAPMLDLLRSPTRAIAHAA
ncbi:MAG: TIGR03087 family PEP-CTERM/XrtA system glycosyltransferase [Phycisphaeraceae bacterium]|nr:TIGR03087 family PEP-CTERM/XrtA system glycosyltransferase [Phycisphaeraceae bacterium]